MTDLYFVRHGESENNLKQLMNGGSVDSPLTDKGRQGAIEAGRFLTNVSFTHAYVSPQARAQTTAALILAQQSHPQPNLTTIEALREFDMGSWDGLPFTQLPQHQNYQNYLHRPDLFDPTETGGESYQALATRGLAAIQDIVAANPTGRVLIVSHGVFLRVVLNRLLGVPLAEVRSGRPIDNCAVTALRADNGHFESIYWNRTDFLTVNKQF